MIDEGDCNNLLVRWLFKLGNRIAEMLSLFANIPKQINLWALFSRIVASRVGNTGKGFKLVSAKVNSVSIHPPYLRCKRSRAALSKPFWVHSGGSVIFGDC